jgi:Tfp pilus assembly protein PilV
MHRHHHQRLLSRRRARGVTLIDALIALVILSFGLIGMTRLQTRALSQATESQERLRAAVLVDQMLSSVIVDAGNRDCYRRRHLRQHHRQHVRQQLEDRGRGQSAERHRHVGVERQPAHRHRHVDRQGIAGHAHAPGDHRCPHHLVSAMRRARSAASR